MRRERIVVVAAIVLLILPVYSQSETITSTTVTSTSSDTAPASTAEDAGKTSTTITKTSTTTVVSDNDAKIVADIYAKYAKESALIGTNIEAKSEDGFVTISGTVTAQSQEDQAITVAKSIPGVKDVISEINVLTNPDIKAPIKPNY